jgi:ketosteroid isomerase-like protein
MTAQPDAQHPAGHDRHAGVDARGDQAMGFSHENTTHHFLLTKDGGIIRVDANAADDSESRDQIRTHLRHIARAFAKGDFALPHFIHAQDPPGVATMKASPIDYKYEERPAGAQVVLRTRDAKALAAIHDFLRFQIADHRTGDPISVSR